MVKILPENSFSHKNNEKAGRKWSNRQFDISGNQQRVFSYLGNLQSRKKHLNAGKSCKPGGILICCILSPLFTSVVALKTECLHIAKTTPASHLREQKNVVSCHPCVSPGLDLDLLALAPGQPGIQQVCIEQTSRWELVCGCAYPNMHLPGSLGLSLFLSLLVSFCTLI